MKEVIIIEPDENECRKIKRMLMEYMKYPDEIQFHFLRDPEDAITMAETKEVAVLVSELDMPLMSGEELFDMYSILSPTTIKIIMTQVKDVAATIHTINELRAYKLINKPIYMREDILTPIQMALSYYDMFAATEQQKNDYEAEIVENQKRAAKIKKELANEDEIFDHDVNLLVGILNANLHKYETRCKPETMDVLKKAVYVFFHKYKTLCQKESIHLDEEVKELLNYYHNPNLNHIIMVLNKGKEQIDISKLVQIVMCFYTSMYFTECVFQDYSVRFDLFEKEGCNVFHFSISNPNGQETQSYKVIDVNERQCFVQFYEFMMKCLTSQCVIEHTSKTFQAKAVLVY